MWLEGFFFYVPWTIGVLLLTIVMVTVFHQVHYGNDRVDGLHARMVLITGCDSGFGNLLAKRLDALGMKVIATCLTESGCTELQKSCSSRLQTMILDVTEDSSISKACATVSKLLEDDHSLEFWALVNNAGIGNYGDFVDWTSVSEMKKVSEVNLWGSVAVTKAFTQLLKQSHGRLIFVSSALGRISFPSSTSYSISKFGVEAFADGLRVELGVFDVDVSLIEPGWFKTRINDESLVSEHLWRKWLNLPQHLQDEVHGLETFQKMHDRNMQFLKVCSPRVDLVVKAMEHAVTSNCPKSRYWVGWDMILFISWFCHLPSMIQDWFLRATLAMKKGKFAWRRSRYDKPGSKFSRIL